MSQQPAEAREVHARLNKAGLEIDASRAYWAHADGREPVHAQDAFDGYWFGARSIDRVKSLLSNMRVRYDPYPDALATLHRWNDMQPDTRRLICHWHLMLADPVYRAFAGTLLPERRERGTNDLRVDLVTAWIARLTGTRWTTPTRKRIASSLMSATRDAGLTTGGREPRALTLPRVPDDALTYLLYLLRDVRIAGTLLRNPYLTSVGLEGDTLTKRLRALRDLSYARQANLTDLDWRYPNLRAWADATIAAAPSPEALA